MRRTRANVALFILLAVSAAVAKDQPKAKQPPQTSAVLWSDPVDIASRNLFYGEGGERDQPHGTMTFLKEAKGGTNPKFDVRDRSEEHTSELQSRFDLVCRLLLEKKKKKKQKKNII